MKKQTKTKKSQKQTKMAVAMNRAVVVHNRRQRIWGIVALAGLFFCGFMLGTDIQHKYAKTNTENNIVDVDDAVPACEVIENRLLQSIRPDDVIDWDSPEYNVHIYTRLAQYGCPENKNKYEQMILREQQIADVFNVDKPKSEKNCEKIEDLLTSLISKGMQIFLNAVVQKTGKNMWILPDKN